MCVCLHLRACVRASERTCLAAGAQELFLSLLWGSTEIGANEVADTSVPRSPTNREPATHRRDGGALTKIDRGGLTLATYVLDFFFGFRNFLLGRDQAFF